MCNYINLTPELSTFKSYLYRPLQYLLTFNKLKIVDHSIVSFLTHLDVFDILLNTNKS